MKQDLLLKTIAAHHPKLLEKQWSMPHPPHDALLSRNLMLAFMLERKKWTQKNTHRIIKHFSKAPAPSADILPYPWNGLEEQLEQVQNHTFPLFSFGSLMNPKSASRDLKTHGHPYLSYGFKRVFSYIYPEIQQDTKELAFLNAFPTGSCEDIVSGIFFELEISEIEPLRHREIGYDLIPIFITEYKEACESKEPKLIPAYYLCAPKNTARCALWEGLEPHMRYLNVCLEGNYHWEDEGVEGFIDLFLQTTFLNDAKTRLDDWLLQKGKQELSHWITPSS